MGDILPDGSIQGYSNYKGKTNIQGDLLEPRANKKLRVLVACEESQAVTIELRKLGHEAFSCDLLPCSGGHPEWHYQQDAFEVVKLGWDKIISFPPCTHIALSGAKHFVKKRASGVQEEGLRFFFEIWRISDCTENPMGIINGGKYIQEWFPKLYKEMKEFGFTFKPTQVIQPWQFGHEAQKTTCLWIKGLPKLTPTEIVEKGEMHTTPSGKVLPKWYSNCGSRKLNRSKTFPGIAKAMALQWAGDITFNENLDF